MKFIDALKAFGEKALADIEIPLKTADKFYLAGQCLVDQLPADKKVVLGLIDAVETFASNIPVDVAGEGLDLPADAKTFKDGVAVVTYFRTVFLPAVEKGIEALKQPTASQPAFQFPAPQTANIGTAPDPAPATLVVTAAADSAGAIDESTIIKPGPGLHLTDFSKQ